MVLCNQQRFELENY